MRGGELDLHLGLVLGAHEGRREVIEEGPADDRARPRGSSGPCCRRAPGRSTRPAAGACQGSRASSPGRSCPPFCARRRPGAGCPARERSGPRAATTAGGGSAPDARVERAGRARGPSGRLREPLDRDQRRGGARGGRPRRRGRGSGVMGPRRGERRHGAREALDHDREGPGRNTGLLAGEIVAGIVNGLQADGGHGGISSPSIVASATASRKRTRARWSKVQSDQASPPPCGPSGAFLGLRHLRITEPTPHWPRWASRPQVQRR